MALYITATPIGNLKDISQRTLEVLKSIEIILAESPEITKKLLNHYEIKPKQIIKYNDRNKKKITGQIIEILKQRDAAYLTSAGTPGISDPGADLVKECRQNNIKVIPLAGPSALIAALSISGIQIRLFSFISFPPKKEGQFKNLLKKYAERKEVLVFFESPYRILKTLKIIEKEFPAARIFLTKELTKFFENYFWGAASEIIKILEADPKLLKGEFTMIIDFQNAENTRK